MRNHFVGLGGGREHVANGEKDLVLEVECIP
jgi:hypothetical protein